MMTEPVNTLIDGDVHIPIVPIAGTDLRTLPTIEDDIFGCDECGARVGQRCATGCEA